MNSQYTLNESLKVEDPQPSDFYYTENNKCLINTPYHTFIIHEEELDILELIEKPDIPHMSLHDLSQEFPRAKSSIKANIKENEKKIRELISSEAEWKTFVYKHVNNYTMRQEAEGMLILRFVTTPIYRLEERNKELKKILLYMSNKEELKGEAVDIEKAKQKPITDYIQFNKMKFANSIFTNEKTPSMKYYPKQNRVHCFSSGRNEDVIGVVMELQKVTFIQAVKFILKN